MKTSVRFGKEDIPRIFAICVSALIYSIGMVVFVRSGNLFPGGYAGVSRLLSLVAQDRFGLNIPFSVIYFGMNVSRRRSYTVPSVISSFCILLSGILWRHF